MRSEPCDFQSKRDGDRITLDGTALYSGQTNLNIIE